MTEAEAIAFEVATTGDVPDERESRRTGNYRERLCGREALVLPREFVLKEPVVGPRRTLHDLYPSAATENEECGND